jgi:hypothetical protein
VLLEADGDKLRVDAPAGELTHEDKTALVEFKPALLKFLSGRPEEKLARKSEARWAGPGWIRIIDPDAGDWHEVRGSECLPGVLAEANRNRKGGAA